MNILTVFLQIWTKSAKNKISIMSWIPNWHLNPNKVYYAILLQNLTRDIWIQKHNSKFWIHIMYYKKLYFEQTIKVAISINLKVLKINRQYSFNKKILVVSSNLWEYGLRSLTESLFTIFTNYK